MENKINWWKVAVYAIAVIGLLVLGFFVGRSTIKESEPEVIYVPGDTIRVEKEKLVPIKEEVDTANVISDCVKNGLFYELFPEKIKDSIIYITLTREDTAKVFNDWATKRFYNEQLFDIDTIGSAQVDIVLQYNRVSDISYTFAPVVKEVIVPAKTKKYSPFIGGGLSTLPSVNLQGGMFAEDKYGISLQYQYDWVNKNNIFGINALIKF